MAETFAKPSRLRRLSELLAERPDWPLRERLLLVERLARQVQSLHQNGRIHRAIAVEQVSVDGEGRPQLPPPGVAAFRRRQLRCGVLPAGIGRRHGRYAARRG